MADGSEHLQIDIDEKEDLTRVRLEGELDVHTAPSLAEAMEQASANGATTIVVDAAALRFCDSSGIQVLVAARERAVEAGGSLTIEGVQGALERVLTVTGLLDLFS
jgi:anti-sigma B factor antagonist